MNRNSLFILSLLVALAGIDGLTAQDEPNLIANPSFEDGAVGLPPPKWSL